MTGTAPLLRIVEAIVAEQPSSLTRRSMSHAIRGFANCNSRCPVCPARISPEGPVQFDFNAPSDHNVRLPASIPKRAVEGRTGPRDGTEPAPREFEGGSSIALHELSVAPYFL